MEQIKVESTMLIRKPAAEIFSYFIEPSKLAQFWLAKADAPLQVGKAVRWEFMVPGAVAQTKATAIEPGKRIAWEWEGENPVTVDFEATPEGTRVHVLQAGYKVTASAAAEAIEGTQGFTIVLCDLKVLLETGKSPGLTKDKAHLIQWKASR